MLRPFVSRVQVRKSGNAGGTAQVIESMGEIFVNRLKKFLMKYLAREITTLAGRAVSWGLSTQQMPELPVNEYVEFRGGKVCIAGTRIGLDVFVYAYRRGKTSGALLEAFPSIDNLAKVQGVITFILEHPQFVESYLRDQDALWDEFRKNHPIPDDMIERLDRTKEGLSRRSA
jgi:uncharacterized protein (DUF433 family)